MQLKTEWKLKHMIEIIFYSPYRKLRYMALHLSGVWTEQIPSLENCLVQEGYLRMVEPKELPAAVSLILTDDPFFAAQKKKLGYVCVGCQGSDGSFFQGCSLVLSELKEVDTEELERHLLRESAQNVPVAETAQLVMHEIREDEIAPLSRISSLPEMGGFTDFFHPDALRSYIHWVYRFYGYGMYAAVLKSENRLIGCCGLNHVIWKDGAERLELQYMVDPEFQRRGFGAEMCLGILKFAEDISDILQENCLWIRTEKENTASRKLAEKLGFSLVSDEETAGSEGLFCYRRELSIS